LPRTFFLLEWRDFPEISVRKDDSTKWERVYPLRAVKCPRPETRTLFLHGRMYKNCMACEINVPVSTGEFYLF
jgi:hypothetical protein